MRRALVTGAGRGVGEGIAEVLAETGVAVAVNDLHPERAETVAAHIGAGAVSAPFDVCDYDAVRAGFAAAEIALGGPLDILVTNAGIPEGRWSGSFRDSAPADWTPYVDLNVYGALYCIRSALPGMCDRGWGRIVQVSSGSAARGLPAGTGESIYGGSKATVDGFLRHLAIEIARDGVTINAVAPGLIEGALGDVGPDVAERILAAVPVGRMGRPREVGSAVAWLVSEDAAYVTGQVIHVNGGAYQGR